MIKRDQIFPLLLKATPGFAPQWEEFLNDWKGEPELPCYICFSEFSRYLIAKLEAKDIADFPEIFAVVDKLIIEGDKYVSDATVVGLLEDMQNTNLHQTTKPDDFRKFLLPESTRWWNKVSDFWEKGILIGDD